MAVNIIKENQGIKGTNIIEHHRNPSGQNNKVKWLLKQSHRDINEIHNIVSKITMSGYDMISSWIVAEMIAVDVVKYGFKGRDEYAIALKEGKIDDVKALNAEVNASDVEAGTASMRVIEMQKSDYDSELEKVTQEDNETPVSNEEIPEEVV